MSTPDPAVSVPVRAASPEVLLVGARWAVKGLADALTAAQVRFTNLGGPMGVGAELERRQPLMVAVGDELGATELAAVGRLARAAAVPMVALSTSRPGEQQLESWSRAGVCDILSAPVDAQQLLTRVTALRKPALPPAQRSRAGRTVLVAGHDLQVTSRLADELVHSGYQVEVVRDAAELTGQALVLNTRVDLLLLVDDLLRPGATGALSAIRRSLAMHGHEVAVLVADATRSPTAAAETPKNCFSVISQQTPPDQIVKRIDELLGRTPNAMAVQSRVPFFSQVTFREAGATSVPWSSGYSFAVSTSGIFIKTLLPARPGAAVEIELPAPGETVGFTGVVAWANHFAPRPVFGCPVGMGVQFLGALSPGLRKVIDHCRQVS